MYTNITKNGFAQKESVQRVLGKLTPLLQLSIWLKCVIIKQHDICVSRFILQSLKKTVFLRQDYIFF